MVSQQDYDDLKCQYQKNCKENDHLKSQLKEKDDALKQCSVTEPHHSGQRSEQTTSLQSIPFNQPEDTTAAESSGATKEEIRIVGIAARPHVRRFKPTSSTLETK
jgi:hypothetical protein